MRFFQEIWHALFSCYLHLEIRLFCLIDKDFAFASTQSEHGNQISLPIDVMITFDDFSLHGESVLTTDVMS